MFAHVLLGFLVLFTCHVLGGLAQYVNPGAIDPWMQFNQYIPQASPLGLVGQLPPNGGDPCANPFIPQYQYHLCSHNYKIQTNPLSYANARGLLRENDGAAVEDPEAAALVDASQNPTDVTANPDPNANQAVAAAPEVSAPPQPAVATPQRRRRRRIRRRHQ